MPINEVISEVTDRIVQRSRDTRSQYLDNMQDQLNSGPRRAHLTCGNQAHASQVHRRIRHPFPERQMEILELLQHIMICFLHISRLKATLR